GPHRPGYIARHIQGGAIDCAHLDSPNDRLRRIEFWPTTSLLSRECLGGRRLGDCKTLRREVAAWNGRADRQRRCIEWKWRVSDAGRVFRYDGITTIRAEH